MEPSLVTGCPYGCPDILEVSVGGQKRLQEERTQNKKGEKAIDLLYGHYHFAQGEPGICTELLWAQEKQKHSGVGDTTTLASVASHFCLKQFNPGDLGTIFRYLFLRNKSSPNSNDLFLPIWWVGNLRSSFADLAWSCSCSYGTDLLDLKGPENSFTCGWCQLLIGKVCQLSITCPPMLQHARWGFSTPWRFQRSNTVGAEATEPLKAQAQSLYITSATFDGSKEITSLAQITEGRERNGDTLLQRCMGREA